MTRLLHDYNHKDFYGLHVRSALSYLGDGGPLQASKTALQ